MQTNVKPLGTLHNIRNFARDFSSLGEEYIFARVEPGDLSPAEVGSPWCFDGVAFIMMLNASGSVTINLDTFEVPSYSVMVIPPDTSVSLHCDDIADMEAYMLFISKQFLQSVNIDPNAIGHHSYNPDTSPILKVSPTDTDLLRRYLSLLRDNADMPVESPYRMSIARNLIANLIYILFELDRQRHTDYECDDKTPRSRRVNYVNDFLRLVRQHHREQRSVSYYADRLFITPKYLSLIIKETTGYSAAHWISRHVILEAKNMLRFSGKNIQQIAYELNFPNQSSFGKYFKHCTGMSPSEFQHS